ncbi:putative ribonuclease H-like domain-containing protein, partial [Tanacetum coccineum]
VPPPYTGNFMPPKPDLSFSGLEEFTSEPIVIKHVAENSEAKASKAKPKAFGKNNEFVKPKQQEKTARKSINHVEQNRQNIHTPRALITCRQVNVAHSKTIVNATRPMSYLSKTTHSTVKRPIDKNIAFKNSNFNQRVNTVKDKNVNTARPKEVVNAVRPKAVVNAVKGNNVNSVKASACWVWKPKNKVLDHVYKHNSASITLKKFDYISNPQMDLYDNGTERKNRTLIEAARTMLADSKLPTTFWAEAVNTACYVQNRVLVTKPHNKTPYELFLGRKPALGFMRPFGCPVTILNIIDHLGKFDGKADKGFFVGYLINSKSFRVFNSRTRIVEETLHVQFSKNTSNIERSGPNWLFDIDALTKLINYKPIVAGNQSNGNAGTKACDDACKMEISSPNDGFKPSVDNEKKVTEEPGKEGGDSNNDQEKEDDNVNSSNNVNTASDGNNTNNVNSVSLTVNVAGIEINVVGAKTSIELPYDPNMPELEDIFYSDDDKDVGAEADMNNLNTFMPVSPIPTTRIHKDHLVEQIIRDLNSAPQTRRMTKNVEEHGLFSSVQQRTNHKDFQNCLFACFLSQEEPKKVIHALKDPSWIEAMQDELLQFKLQKGTHKKKGLTMMKSLPLFPELKQLGFLAYASFKDFVVYQMDVKSSFLYAPRAWYETLSTYLLDNGFKRGKIDKTLFIRRDKGLQVKQKEDGIFISQDKYVTEILKKFGFTDVKTASTPMETQKPLLRIKMVKKWIYQTNPKVSHLHVVKRIFRYLKGQPKLGLWYPKDSPFDLVAYTDSDYPGASLDRKSTTVGCQFLRYRFISWQRKKQTVVSNSTTEAEYVVASSCCGQLRTLFFIQKQSTLRLGHHFIKDSMKKANNMIKIHTDKNVAHLLTKEFDVKTVNGEQQLQALVDGKKILVTEASVRRDLQLDDEEATNQKFNCSKYIFESMVKNLDNAGKFLMYPRMPKEKDTQVPQSSVPSDPTNVVDEAVNEEPSMVGRSASRLHLVDETQGRYGDEDMFGVNDLDGDEVVVESEVTDKAGEKINIVEEAVAVTDCVTILVSAATITNVELTLAQTLAELKSARPKTKGVVMQEPSESTPTISLQLPSQVKGQGSKDKGKAKMIEPEKPLKKKYQIKFDEEEALRLQVKFDEEDRFVREKAQQVEEANIAWDDIQAKIDADYQLAERLQAQEQQELTIEEKSTLFVQLLEKRKKHFAAKRAEEKRNRPPTRAQQRSIMCTYLKNRMEAQRFKEQERAKMKELMEIVPDEEEVSVDAIPLATKPPSIVDWKIVKEGKISYYQTIRADGSSKRPEEGYERVLWGDLKTMFEHHVEDAVWRNLQENKVLV